MGIFPIAARGIVAVHYYTALYKPPPGGAHVKNGAKVMAKGALTWSSVSDVDLCEEIAPHSRTAHLLLAVYLSVVFFFFFLRSFSILELVLGFVFVSSYSFSFFVLLLLYL